MLRAVRLLKTEIAPNAADGNVAATGTVNQNGSHMRHSRVIPCSWPDSPTLPTDQTTAASRVRRGGFSAYAAPPACTRGSRLPAADGKKTGVQAEPDAWTKLPCSVRR